MADRTRNEIIQPGDVAQLRALFKDSFGNPVDLDIFPSITINQPSGNVALGPTSIGVYRLDTGLYGYDFAVGINPSLGVNSDIWDGVLLGVPVTGTFQFMIHSTQMPYLNTDGYVALGDDVGFNYSQIAIQNINVLMKTLRARLDSRGKATVTDEFGNDILVDCDIFTVDSLTCFIADSLTMFNEIPHFTNFTFEDTDILQQFHNVIVQGAVLMALSSKALLERGREFNFTDNGIAFTPPTVSELMTTQWSAELANHLDKLRGVKASMKPGPYGLGTLTISSSRSPAIARLRHLRARQLY
jgi:hypothetical protein